jgi:phage tail sheath gpL-like
MGMMVIDVQTAADDIVRNVEKVVTALRKSDYIKANEAYLTLVCYHYIALLRYSL